MIPIKDDNPTRRTPWLTLAIIAINVAAFVYSSTLDATALQALWMRWAFVPTRFFADALSPTQIATVFTAMFLHGGWLHLGGNMLYLWIFGNNIEDRLGHVWFLAFYLACGIAATFAQGFLNADSALPMLGASGAVAGVLGAYLLLFPGAAVLTVIPIFIFIEIARVPAYLVIGFWFVLQLFSGIASLGPVAASTGGVAYFAHVGGFVAGFVLALPAGIASRRRRRRPRMAR